MKEYLVIYYDGNEIKHGWFNGHQLHEKALVLPDFPEDYDIQAIIEVASTAVQGVWIDGEPA